MRLLFSILLVLCLVQQTRMEEENTDVSLDVVNAKHISTNNVMTEESLQTLFVGQFTHCLWARAIDKQPTEQQPQSILAVKNMTGFAETFFTYQAHSSSPLPPTRIANLLIIRFYDSPYVNTNHTQLRLPLLNYTNGKWEASTLANVSRYSGSSSKLASFNLFVRFRIDSSKIVLWLAAQEMIAITEDREIEVLAFPLVYLPLVGINLLMTELITDASARRVSPLLVVAMTIKMFCRAVFLFTQSFTVQRPYGVVLIFLAVLITVAVLRFAHRYRRCLGNGKHNRRATLTLLLIIGAEMLLVFNPYYNCAASLLLSMQILVNSASKRTPQPQHAITVCFVIHNMLPIYYSLGEANLFRVQPVSWAGYFMLVAVLVQLIVLKLQENRSTIRRWLWKRKPAQQFVSGDCPICLTAIGTEPFMVTECKHVFHEECLRCWAEIRMQCPLDRQPISDVEGV